MKPVLVGSLVTLRPFEDGDSEPAWEMINDPEANDLTQSSNGSDRASTAAWYATRNQQDFRLDLAIVENTTGDFAGEAVLNEYDPTEDCANFRISLRGPAWYGRGLGTEATQLIVDHGLRVIGLRRIELTVLARNSRAKAVYRRVGFDAAREFDEDGERWIKMVIDRSSARWPGHEERSGDRAPRLPGARRRGLVPPQPDAVPLPHRDNPCRHRC